MRSVYPHRPKMSTRKSTGRKGEHKTIKENRGEIALGCGYRPGSFYILADYGEDGGRAEQRAMGTDERN